jgi:small subunit ribosomal protein S7
MLLEEKGKKSYKLQEIKPDPLYNSVLLSKFINQIMKDGKKNAARKVVYGALEEIKKKEKQDPMAIFEKAISNVSPDTEVRSKRVGGATYQVPMKVTNKRAISLSFRWIIGAARSKKGKPMKIKLFEEIANASRNEGEAIRKKENVHKMAKANRAFAYLAK